MWNSWTEGGDFSLLDQQLGGDVRGRVAVQLVREETGMAHGPHG